MEDLRLSPTSSPHAWYDEDTDGHVLFRHQSAGIKDVVVVSAERRAQRVPVAEALRQSQ